MDDLLELEYDLAEMWRNGQRWSQEYKDLLQQYWMLQAQAEEQEAAAMGCRVWEVDGVAHSHDCI